MRPLSKRTITIITVVVAVATIYPVSVILTENATMPRRLAVGDLWVFKVVFPDSTSYELTESVNQLSESNGTEVYVLFLDDVQHLSTKYLWITADWHEVRTFTPNIGNLFANSTVIYTPPVELFHIPFHVGDQWTVKSFVRTITVVKNATIDQSSFLIEERATSSMEDVSTPLGHFHTFKVSVMVNRTLSELLWFDTSVGEVVYGEFYNGKEKVTQTLIAYRSSFQTASTAQNIRTCEDANVSAISLLENFRKLYLHANCPLPHAELKI